MAKLPSVVQFNEEILQIKELIQQTGEITYNKIQQISETKKFTSQDSQEFNDLLNEIKQDALRRIAGFYQAKLQDKIQVFQEEVFLNIKQQLTSYGGANNQNSEIIEDIQLKLSQGITVMKNRQEKKNHQVLNLILETEKSNQIKTAFQSLKKYFIGKQQKRQKSHNAYQYYTNKLSKKCLCSWYGLSYKEGFQNNLIKIAQQDIRAIQSHFGDMVKLLRLKIAEADDLIQIKRNAKAEFSYSLSRNLLKTISNLSMEVITLNQVVIKDNSTNNEDVTRFMREINNRLNEKMNGTIFIINQDVQQIRDRLAPPRIDMEDKKRPVIQFDL